MLPAPNRLRRANDIVKVYKKGVYGGAGILSAKAARNNRGESRAVVIVGKKVSKRAVVRNRIRRRIVELLRTQWATVVSGYDIVVTAHTDIAELPSAELEAATIKALKRAGVIS